MHSTDIHQRSQSPRTVNGSVIQNITTVEWFTPEHALKAPLAEAYIQQIWDHIHVSAHYEKDYCYLFGFLTMDEGFLLFRGGCQAFTA